MKIAKKIFSKFNSLNMYKKIFYINILIMVMFVFAFGVIQYFMVKDLIVEQYKYSASHNNEQTSSLITGVINDYSTAINMLEGEEIVDEFIRVHSFDENDTKNVIAENERYLNFSRTVEKILSVANINNYSIYTYDGFVYGNNMRAKFTNEDMQNTKWYKRMTENKRRIMYFDSSYFSENEKASDDFIYCVGLIYSYENYDKYVGAIRLGIPKSEILKIMNENVIISDCSSAIYNKNGDMVLNIGSYDKNIENVFKTAFNDENNEFMQLSSNFQSYIAVKHPTELVDWVLIDVLPLNKMLNSYYDFEWKIFMAFALLFALILFILHKVFVSYGKRLTLLVDTMTKYKLDTVNTIEQNDVHDDIGKCIDAYNLMATNINDMFKEQKETSEKLNSYNMQIMYERVNPHFLYNTLEIINSMAIERGIDCISNSVQKLAEYYKISLNNTREELALEREIRHSELYVDICNQRFNKKIIFCCEVPDELLDIEVPKMILQPIIENSIKYGFIGENADRDNEIIVAAYRRGEYIDIEVTDNGFGIPSDKLKQLQSMDSNAVGIGLRSTNERLKLRYGDECGITISSKKGIYTTVTLRIKE